VAGPVPRQGSAILVDLARKTALITGGAQGIGKAIAKRFHAAGSCLIVVDTSEKLLLDLASELGDNIITCAADVSCQTALQSTLAPVIAAHRPVDILVNNAATVTRRAKITDLGLEEWERTLSVNLTGAFLLSRMIIPQMCANGGGVILNIASQLGHVAVEGAAAYCTTKGGMLQFTRALALDHAEDNIRVVALSPGAVHTPRLNDIFGSREAAEETLGPAHPAGRLGRADEVADAALFLVSNEASFITGTDLIADGGYTAR
jgi:NAD(P)-dependent dehydrogenase (short-subunit alcohol dehydrogenase family)